MNRYRGTRFCLTIKAAPGQFPDKTIALECNNGFKYKFESDEYTADGFREALAAAFKEMKLEELSDNVVAELLKINYLRELPAVIEPAEMADLFNSLHLHVGGLQPSYAELKQYWAEQFNNAVKKKNVTTRNHARGVNKRNFSQNLNIYIGAFDLVKTELKRFGGFWWRFSVEDAVQMLGKGAGGKQSIDCVHFCSAMERCVRRIMRPSLISGFRPLFARMK